MAAAGLELRGVRKSYGTLVAVNDLGLAVRPGEVFGFVGSNGAGKTTTMRVLLGTLIPDRGDVLWNGSPIGFAVRRRIGYMPEERGLYPKMRIGEQLIYLAELHGATRAEAAAAVTRWQKIPWSRDECHLPPLPFEYDRVPAVWDSTRQRGQRHLFGPVRWVPSWFSPALRRPWRSFSISRQVAGK